MPSHEMRRPTADRPVVCILPSNALRGNGILYRLVHDPGALFGAMRPDGNLGRVPANPTSHADDRVATVNRPLVRVVDYGAVCRCWRDTAGRFLIEAIA
ncbi:hypothetical protein [Mycobacteroides chelonae]|uniref:hypothetical protein n=1 Tax=Mycobacteroides chelonae TaxID=1774 RepID=UPI0012FFAF64|nr:hypothetical protein [Mycobacteroides chelonae]